LHAAEHGGDQVELEQPDQAPVEPADDREDRGCGVELLMDPSFCLEFV
jgi:hypothetical protein